MKNIFRYIFILTIIFLLPISVHAEDENFKYIDFDSDINLTYKVSGSEEKVNPDNLYVDDETPINIELYRIDNEGTEARIEFSTEEIHGEWITDEVTNKKVYRISNVDENTYFDKESEYKIKYNANVNGTTVVYQKEYNYTKNPNDTNDGILININDNISPKLKITKVLTKGTPNGTFAFNISGNGLSRDIEVTTENGIKELEIENLDLSINTEYIIKEVSMPDTSYKFVSIESNPKNIEVSHDDETKSITIKPTTDNLNTTVEVVATNASKVDHVKEINDNEDGTYTLSLDVTGSANIDSSTAKANILIVFDTSTSMYNFYLNSTYFIKIRDDGETGIEGSSNASYYKTNSDAGERIYWVNGAFRTGYRRTDPVYDGPVYVRFTTENDRGSATELIMHYFVKDLLAYNSLEGNNPDDPNVQLALVKFNGSGTEVCFNSNGTTNCNGNNYWTTQNSIANWFSYDAQNKRSDSDYARGTNWKAGLDAANTILAKADKDPTYVIFITDGAPTEPNPTGTITDPSNCPTGVNSFYCAALKPARDIQTYNTITHQINSNDSNTTLFGILAFGNNDTGYANGDYLDDLVYYAHTGLQRELPSGSNSVKEAELVKTHETDGYYNASNPDDLDSAIQDIFRTISDTLGVGSVAVIDNTTSGVEVNSGAISGSIDEKGLLHIDENSYRYYLSMDANKVTEPLPTEIISIANSQNPSYGIIDNGNGTVTRNDEVLDEVLNVYTIDRKDLNASNSPVEYKIYAIDNQDGTITCVWIDQDNNNRFLTINGNIETITEDDANKYRLKYRWTEANYMYANAPPPAHLDKNKYLNQTDEGGNPIKNPDYGAVKWDLNSLKTLLDGVTYTIEFDVWPSQVALDLIADLKNDPSLYNTLSDEVKKYLISDGNGGYTLYTNTENARITYEDSRDEEVEIPISYVNPDPVVTDAQKIKVEKKWINLLDSTSESSIKLYVTRDGKKHGAPVDLSTSNQWKNDVYISVGSISVQYTKVEGEDVPVKARILEPGYDYAFVEDDYHWHLEVDTMHPMMINNHLTMLVKTNEKTVDDIGDANVLVDGNDTYYVIGDYVYKVKDVENIFTVTNYRKSNLNLIKKVDGNIPETTLFTFKITVNSPTDSQIYFGVQDYNDLSIPEEDRPFITDLTTSSNVSREERYVDLTDTNVELISNTPSEDDPMKGTLVYKYKGTQYTVEYFNVRGSKYIYGYTNYYVFNNGDEITVNLRPNWNLRFTSLEKNTTYQFVEVIDSTKFKIDNSEVKVTFKDHDGNMVTKTISDDIDTLDGITLTSSIYNRSNDLYTLSGMIYTNNRNFQALYNNISLKNYLTIEKKWVDDNNPNRPTSLTVNLTGTVDGEEIGSQEISFVKTSDEARENIWTYSVEVDRYHNNQEIVYSASEEVVPVGYVMSKGEDDLHIINTLSRNISGTKTWLDNNNFDNVRPESIIVVLTGKVGSKVVVEPIRLSVASILPTTNDAWNTDTVWDYVFSNLPMYDTDGNVITYTIDEDLGNIASNYLKDIDNTNFNITNVYRGTHTSIKVNKMWDSNYADDYPEIVISLTSNPDGYSRTNIPLNANNVAVCADNPHCWEYMFTDLPMYHFNDNDTYDIITYTLSEVSIAGEDVTNNIVEIRDGTTHVLLRKWHVSIDGYTITNTVEEMPKVSLIFKKVADVELDDNHNITGYNAKSGAKFKLFIYVGDKSIDPFYNKTIDYNNPDSYDENWILIGEATSIDSESDELKGLVTFDNLYEGEYRLVEIEAPDGYVLPKGQWRVMVSKVNDGLEVSFSVVGSTAETPAFITNTNPDDTKFLIPNYEIPDIPSTGGIGIPNYRQNGLLLMSLSVLVLIISQIIQNKKQENF